MMILNSFTKRLALSLIPLFLLSSVYAEDEKKKDAKPEGSLTIKSEPLKVEVKLKGFFEAVETSEISIRPEAWSGMSLTVGSRPYSNGPYPNGSGYLFR